MNSAEHHRGSVLVVDDEPTISEVVSRYLERAGYETRTAADGPAGKRNLKYLFNIIALKFSINTIDTSGRPR